MGTGGFIFILIFFSSITLGIISESKAKPKTKKLLIRLVLVIAIISIPVFLLISGKSITIFKPKPIQPTQPKVYTEEDRKRTAYVCAKFKVEEELKAPSTAKFQPSPDAVITNNGSYYFVKSYVDAQNSFGAMIRTDFICKVSNPNPETIYCQSEVCSYQ
jgi:hypothetical protein